MKMWTNTKTLEGFVDDLLFTESPSEADIAVLGSKSIKIKDFPNLKGIFRVGVGSDNIPFEEAKQRNIKVAFPKQKTIEYIFEETANFTCFLIFKMMYSDIGTIEPWKKTPREFLGNKNLLVIGQGNIGKRVSNKMSHFLNVVTYDERYNKISDLKSKMQIADCVSLHIPYTENNKNFIDSEKMSWMKNGSSLINTSRGAIVSEDSLEKELENNRLKAAFDVFWKEPYEGKLKKYYPNIFYMTPHVSSTNKEFLCGSSKDLKMFIKEIENA
jgi:lactate dehydrogenase-like 2-hydroxyacid dehydrogenase